MTLIRNPVSLFSKFIIVFNLPLCVISATEWSGFHEPGLEIQVYLGPKKCIRVVGQTASKLHRNVDLTHSKRITVYQSCDGKQRYILVKLDKEYDLVLKFHHVDDRTEFVSDLQSFLREQDRGPALEKLVLREQDLLRIAMTRQQRQEILEKFVRLALYYVSTRLSLHSSKYRRKLLTLSALSQNAMHVIYLHFYKFEIFAIKLLK